MCELVSPTKPHNTTCLWKTKIALTMRWNPERKKQGVESTHNSLSFDGGLTRHAFRPWNSGLVVQKQKAKKKTFCYTANHQERFNGSFVDQINETISRTVVTTGVKFNLSVKSTFIWEKSVIVVNNYLQSKFILWILTRNYNFTSTLVRNCMLSLLLSWRYPLFVLCSLYHSRVEIHLLCCYVC